MEIEPSCGHILARHAPTCASSAIGMSGLNHVPNELITARDVAEGRSRVFRKDPHRNRHVHPRCAFSISPPVTSCNPAARERRRSAGSPDCVKRMAEPVLKAPPASIYIAAQHPSEQSAKYEWEELVRDSEAMWNESQAGASRLAAVL